MSKRQAASNSFQLKRSNIKWCLATFFRTGQCVAKWHSESSVFSRMHFDTNSPGQVMLYFRYLIKQLQSKQYYFWLNSIKFNERKDGSLINSSTWNINFSLENLCSMKQGPCKKFPWKSLKISYCTCKVTLTNTLNEIFDARFGFVRNIFQSAFSCSVINWEIRNNV